MQVYAEINLDFETCACLCLVNRFCFYQTDTHTHSHHPSPSWEFLEHRHGWIDTLNPATLLPRCQTPSYLSTPHAQHC